MITVKKKETHNLDLHRNIKLFKLYHLDLVTVVIVLLMGFLLNTHFCYY